MKQRLESLDALRGFDLFCLVALSDLVEELAEVVDKPWMGSLMQHKQVALLRAGAICRRLLRLPHSTEQLHYPLHYLLSIMFLRV